MNLGATPQRPSNPQLAPVRLFITRKPRIFAGHQLPTSRRVAEWVPLITPRCPSDSLQLKGEPESCLSAFVKLYKQGFQQRSLNKGL
jgi:hypothetical protein